MLRFSVTFPPINPPLSSTPAQGATDTPSATPPQAPPIPSPRALASPQESVSTGGLAGAPPDGTPVQQGRTTFIARPAVAEKAQSAPIEVETRVRGPRHRRPLLLRIVGFIHLVRLISFLGSVVGVPLVLALDPENLPVVLIFPILLVISGILWLFGSSKVGCRVCAMRMYQNKRCVKSRKAPSVPFLGPHTTLAILSLCSNSVRCPYCGTPNSLNGRYE